MSLLLLLRILFLLFFMISVCESNEIRKVKVVKNVDFQNKKVTETPVKTMTVRSKMECIVECKQTDACLSFSFNDGCKMCLMYDKDFVNVAETSTTDEMGWSYHYLVPGEIMDKTKCMIQSRVICQSFCFVYKIGFSSNTIQDFMQACSDEGGEVLKVDRYLKQYCMERAIDPVLGPDALSLNGMKNEATGEWTYFDGTKITYFNWDVHWSSPQPDYKSPMECIIMTRQMYNYHWHDGEERKVNVVVCEIKSI